MSKLEPKIISKLNNRKYIVSNLINELFSETEVDKKKIEERINILIRDKHIIKENDMLLLADIEEEAEYTFDEFWETSPFRKTKSITKKEFSKHWSEMKRKTVVKECCYPNHDECVGKIKRAHSIQNNRILSKIASDGKVLMIGRNASFFNSDLEEIGRREATTFFGFCDKHDTQLFIDIEQKDYEKNNLKQNFLFVYRTFAREYIMKKFQLNVAKYLDDNPNMKEFLESSQQGLNDLTNYKIKMDEVLLNKHYDQLITKVLIFDNAYLLAVSSAFAPEYNLQGNIINDFANDKELSYLCINIFPQQEKLFVLLSYHQDHKIKLEKFVNEIGELDENKQKHLIELLICDYCENFAISPEYWTKISSSIRKKFVQKFRNTDLKEPNHLSRITEWNLF